MMRRKLQRISVGDFLSVFVFVCGKRRRTHATRNAGRPIKYELK